MNWNDLSWFKQPHSWANALSEFRDVIPHHKDWFKAFHTTPFDDVRVVILGQDPYPTPGYATGLAFSVPPDKQPLPASLKNIFSELVDDLGLPLPSSGDLTPWAKQGVLLLNTALTTEPHKPGCHTDLWKELITEVISTLEREREGLVFVLWGKHAQGFLPLVLPSPEHQRHHVILSSHPSPLSAHRGFMGSKPFSRINSFLDKPIDWRLP